MVLRDNTGALLGAKEQRIYLLLVERMMENHRGAWRCGKDKSHINEINMWVYKNY